MNNIVKRWFGILILSLFLHSCNQSRNLTEAPSPNNTATIIDSMTARLMDYNSFGAKIATVVKVKGEKKSFKTNLRLQKDSAIWMSVSPALGIEVARLIITPDSIKFIDKWNDQYFIGDHSFLKEKMNLELEFDVLQDMIVGDPVLFDVADKLKSDREEKHYTLSSKNKGRVRRAAGEFYQEREEEGGDSTTIKMEDRTFDRLTRHADTDGDLVVKRYWIDGETWKMVRTIITDLGTKRSIETNITEHAEHEGQLVPKKAHYIMTDIEEVLTFEMEYSRIKIDHIFTFPFQIPDKFERIN